MTRSHDSVPRLSRWETLGAWLHVWTPHRDAEVPPVPWRTITIGTLLTVVAVAVAAALAVPRIDAAKHAGAVRDARALAASRAAERRRVQADQVAHHGSAVVPPGLEAASRSRVIAARRALFAQAQAAVLADARARVRRGALKGPVRALRCQVTPPAVGPPPHPELDPSAHRAAWDCTAVTGFIARTAVNVAGAIGYPFRLKVDFPRFSYVWCKEDPIAGEQAIPDPRRTVPLPRACRT